MKFSWPTVPIGCVAKPIERPEAPVPGKSYRQIGVRWWGEGVYEREAIDGGDTQYAVMNRLVTDDIVINKIWARHGSVSVVQPELDGCYCSTEFPIFRPDFEQLEPRWFYWMTKTKDLRQNKLTNFTGSLEWRICRAYPRSKSLQTSTGRCCR